MLPEEYPDCHVTHVRQTQRRCAADVSTCDWTAVADSLCRYGAAKTVHDRHGAWALSNSFVSGHEGAIARPWRAACTRAASRQRTDSQTRLLSLIGLPMSVRTEPSGICAAYREPHSSVRLFACRDCALTHGAPQRALPTSHPLASEAISASHARWTSVQQARGCLDLGSRTGSSSRPSIHTSVTCANARRPGRAS